MSSQTPTSTASTPTPSTTTSSASGAANIGGGISALSGLISGIGAIMAGQSTANSLNAQANLQLQNAQEAEAQGQYNALKSQLASSLKLGTISANYGASGVQATSGSVQDVIASSTSSAELDRLNILHGADVKAINYENQAAMDKVGAQSAITGSYFQAAGSIIGGTAKGIAFGIAAAPTTTTPGGVGTAVDGSPNANSNALGNYNFGNAPQESVDNAGFTMPGLGSQVQPEGGNYLDAAHGWVTMDQSDIGI